MIRATDLIVGIESNSVFQCSDKATKSIKLKPLLLQFEGYRAKVFPGKSQALNRSKTTCSQGLFHGHRVLLAQKGQAVLSWHHRESGERGVFRSVGESERPIQVAIDQPNQAPRPYHWTAEAEDILGKVTWARTAPNDARSLGP